MRDKPRFISGTMKFTAFTGGVFDTNCFFIEEQGILIDAPQGSADWLQSAGFKVNLLLLTHGHIDHVWDAACIKREHQCRVGYHPDGIPMLTEPDFFKKFGFMWEIEPVAADLLLEEQESADLGGMRFKILLLPGHCPGSLGFFDPASRVLFGGDVLFAGGVGRWDLPGGDQNELLESICGKVLPLGDDVIVQPGHGPSTTVGEERRSNPFLAR